MALRVTAMVATLPPPPSSAPKPQLKLSPPALSPSPPALSLLTVFSAPVICREAKAIAFSKETIVSSLTKAEETLNQVQETGDKVLNYSQQVFKVLIDALNPAVDAALPVLQGAGEEALKVASPVVSDASKQAQEALQSIGVEPSAVMSVAKTVADAAQQTTKVIEAVKPFASATVDVIASSDPSTIAVSTGALFLFYLILPSLGSAISFNFRGYKGSLSPAQTLHFISAQDHLLIDIRPEKDTIKVGVPCLPTSAKNKMISVPLEELPSKVKGIVKNVKNLEAEIVALKIFHLKRVNKDSNIVIMDSYADIAKIVARVLTDLGFKNCWIVMDGFSGNKGWIQSRLGTNSYDAPITEVSSPSQVIPAALARIGTTASAALQSARSLLPRSTDV